MPQFNDRDRARKENIPITQKQKQTQKTAIRARGSKSLMKY